MKTEYARLASCIALTLAAASPTLAADGDIEAIRPEIKQIRDDYETRIKALEKRLEEAEAKAQRAEAAATKAQTSAQQGAAPPAATGSQATFNPGIGLILSGQYNHLSKDPGTYHIAGFIPGGEEIGPGERSFNLGESELSLFANVDPYFYGQFTAAVTPENEVEVEEAFIKTLALPAGLSLKGGRFFSGIGYLNEIHAHAWDFVDAPLAYQAFLGGQFAQEGLQLKWLAPTPVFLELGLEAGNGRRFPGAGRNKNGANGGAVFGHLGGDIGESLSWRGGVSYLSTRAAQGRDAFQDDSEALGAAAHTFTGKSKVWIADFVLKWAPNGNSAETNFKFQAEYFRGKESGELASEFGGVVDEDGNVLVPPLSTAGGYSSTKTGFYVQGVYQFLPRWRVGLRYDQLDSGSLQVGSIGTTDTSGAFTFSEDDYALLKTAKPKRTSLMFDWSPSEFSRIRLQYAQDKARRDETDNQFFIQYIHSLGAHGAHKF